MTVNYKLIAAFLAVAQNESFSHAAGATHRTAAAVSVQIKRLEEQLGVALFHRTTRKVVLTSEGRQFLSRARRAMAEIELGLGELRKTANLESGRLSFACSSTIAGTRLPAALVAFSLHHPGVVVHVLEQVSEALLASVRSGEVDFGIGPAPDETRNEFNVLPVFRDVYCALLPQGYPDTGRKSISLAEVVRMPMLSLAAATAFRAHIDATLRAHGLFVKDRYEFMSVGTVVAMVNAGLGIALLPRSGIPDNVALKTVRIVRPALSRTIAIITRRGHSLSPAAGRFIALFRQQQEVIRREKDDSRRAADHRRGH